MASQHFRVLVSGWKNSRRASLEIHDDSATLRVEITIVACSDCTVCSRRVSSIAEKLRGSDASWRFVNIGEGTYLSIDHVPQEPVSAAKWLGEQLGLDITASL